MSEQTTTPPAQENWTEFVENMNEQMVEAFEANVEAQSQFVETWAETLAEGTDDDRIGDGVEGYARAYQVWMDAAEEMAGQVAEEGGDVSPEDARDLWLSSANEAFKEVMSTSAFAAVTGETVEDALELRQAADENAQETLHALGMATERDIREVGDRLVELERRQHAIEEKLDDVLDALDEE
ncbi:poly(R)-hydroxyalkanoic acid synthase subunit PhaE [Salinarchaeum laminariae]|uniref:poly(R)-hydroxyalkanoic acid synthase subunit PhaE n=1 Tax=Salinarchaeum laminariae TaxID=869888 RepID=UPI0020BED294|nr:poly(R)-hydroxyalkanoic acid synthase subunit PhaE [Salinarchaeum laminariae]